MTDSKLLGLWALDPDPAQEGPARAFLRLEQTDDGVALHLQELGADDRWTTRGARLPEAVVRSAAEPGGLLHLHADGLGPCLDLCEGDARFRFRPVLEDVKQVLLYRRDLKMRKGKIAAQVAHASLKVLLDRDEGSWDRLSIPLDAAMASWTRARFAKVVLSVETEADLLRAHQLARERGLPTALITDAGRTEFHGVPTKTTCAIGPARIVDIDAITGPSGLVPTKLA